MHRPTTSIALLLLLGAGCDPVSRLHGTVRTPAEECAGCDEKAVAGSTVELLCPHPKEMRVVGEPSPAVTDANGEWNTYAVSFDTVDEACRIRVKKAGYEPFEETIAALPHQVGPEVRTVHVQIRLRRAQGEPR